MIDFFYSLSPRLPFLSTHLFPQCSVTFAGEIKFFVFTFPRAFRGSCGRPTLALFLCLNSLPLPLLHLFPLSKSCPMIRTHNVRPLYPLQPHSQTLGCKWWEMLPLTLPFKTLATYPNFFPTPNLMVRPHHSVSSRRYRPFPTLSPPPDKCLELRECNRHRIFRTLLRF